VVVSLGSMTLASAYRAPHARMGAATRRRRPNSFKRECLMPDPRFSGSWIPDERRRERLIPIAAVIVEVLKAQSGIGLRKLRVAVRNRLGRCTDADTDAALYLLGAAIERTVGPRGAHQYAIEMAKVPPVVLAHSATIDNANPP
jgi:hypothetical protein